MKVTMSHIYDASPDDVLKMLADPDFRAKVSEAQDVVSHDITIRATPDGFTLINDQVQRTGDLPSIAKKFAGETTRAVQRERWTGMHAEMAFETPGTPADMSGTIDLTPTDDGRTTETTTFDVRVKVPLIGKKLESLVGEAIKSGIEIEHTVGDAWLAGER